MEKVAVIRLYELTRDEVKQRKENQQVLIYNSLTGVWKIEWCDKKCIARSIHCSEFLRFYCIADDIEELTHRLRGE